MKKPVKAYRCEHCDRIIDIEREFHIRITTFNAKVNIPIADKKFASVEVDVALYDWRDEVCALCSETCLANWINAEARRQLDAPTPAPQVEVAAPSIEPAAPKVQEEPLF